MVMTGRMISGALLAVAGLASGLMGLLFLMAAEGTGRRLMIGLILLGVGVLLLIPGVRLFSQGLRYRPAAIRQRLLQLARMHNGELPLKVVYGEWSAKDEVEDIIRQMTAGEMVRREARPDGDWLLFPQFFLEMVQKRCPFCGNDYPVRENVEKCPSCGGDLVISKQKVARSDDYFAMDE
jgi:hypothetical protein